MFTFFSNGALQCIFGHFWARQLAVKISWSILVLMIGDPLFALSNVWFVCLCGLRDVL